MTDRGFGFQPSARKHSILATLSLCCAALAGMLLAAAMILTVHATQCTRDSASVRVGGMLVAGCDIQPIANPEARQ
jgi:hypothetical protein